MIRRPAVAVALALVCLGTAGCTTAPAAGTVDVDLPEPFLLDTDFADPDLLTVGDELFAYATQSDDAHVQMASRTQAGEWELLPTDAFPRLPEWAVEGDTWSPEVSAWGGGYLLFHSSTDSRTDVQCIGVAVSASPLGPFVEDAERPLICPRDGAIDPQLFVDVDGSPHLLWKVDGNCCGGDGSIWIAPLTPDGQALSRDPALLLETSLLWEDDVVEAPTLVRRGAEYLLFYSAGDYYGLGYSIGVARADSLLGPYEKRDQPLLSTESSDFAFIGPGGQDVVGDTIYFHSWDPDHRYRGMHEAQLDWAGDAPAIVLPRAPD